MADTEKAAPAAVASPTVGAAAESTDAKAEVNTTTSTEAATEAKAAATATKDGDSKAKAEDDGEQKWALNGKSKDKDAREDDRNGRSDNRRGGHRGGGRGGFQNRKKRNNEFDNLPESDDPVEIRNQVEFYFSTHNLITDEHLFTKIGGPKNLPVSIKHIADFKRMRRFQPYSAIVKALRESKDLVVVDDGEYSAAGAEAVQRKVPLQIPAEEGDEKRNPTILDLFYRLKQASTNRLEASIYVKDFGIADDAGQIAIEQFFRPYGSVMVRKRRDEDNSWKGSVFVEFDTEESQKQFLALDPKPKFNDNELTIMGKREYIVMKCDEKGIEPNFDNHRESHGHSRGRGGRGRGGRGGRGGYGGRRDNNRSYDDRSRNRKRRDRSASDDSVDSRDWNNRRDRFQKGRNDRGSRKEEERKEIERDAYGVPIIRDTRTDAEIAAASKKRKGEADERADSPKKGKLEIKQDE